MAKKILLHTALWHKPKINKIKSWRAKLVMIYLLSNPKVSRTGIYIIFSEEIASGIGRDVIDAEQAREAIKELELTGLIKYEHVADIVYIININQYGSVDSGRPDIVAKEILDDFNDLDRENKMVMQFWLDYVQINQEELKALNDNATKCKYNKTSITLQPILDLFLPKKN